jgi:pimeloyl-ACP methyl ester carboxylesterase
MPTVISTDGTPIAYDREGSGPALVLVDGAMCYRAAGPMRPLASLLIGHFTVFTYDRRGRGESGDTLPYAVEREVEDLQAVIGEAGGTAALYAMSSGGGLALATAAAGPGVTRMALYEPPYLAGVEDGTRIKEYTARLGEVLQDGRRGDAIALFMTNVGIPEQVVAGMRRGPGWAALEAIAPTLAYDDALLTGGVVPAGLPIGVPTLVVSGSASPDSLQQAARDTAAAYPVGEHRSLPGQTHDVRPDAIAPVLIDFLLPCQKSVAE